VLQRELKARRAEQDEAGMNQVNDEMDVVIKALEVRICYSSWTILLTIDELGSWTGAPSCR
jgi:hypothetical protein